MVSEGTTPNAMQHHALPILKTRSSHPSERTTLRPRMCPWPHGASQAHLLHHCPHDGSNHGHRHGITSQAEELIVGIVRDVHH